MCLDPIFLQTYSAHRVESLGEILRAGSYRVAMPTDDDGPPAAQIQKLVKDLEDLIRTIPDRTSKGLDDALNTKAGYPRFDPRNASNANPTGPLRQKLPNGWKGTLLLTTRTCFCGLRQPYVPDPQRSYRRSRRILPPRARRCHLCPQFLET